MNEFLIFAQFLLYPLSFPHLFSNSFLLIRPVGSKNHLLILMFLYSVKKKSLVSAVALTISSQSKHFKGNSVYIPIRQSLSDKTLAFEEGTNFSFPSIATCEMTGA